MVLSYIKFNYRLDYFELENLNTFGFVGGALILFNDNGSYTMGSVESELANIFNISKTETLDMLSKWCLDKCNEYIRINLVEEDTINKLKKIISESRLWIRLYSNT